jgi:hypothetical protein
VDGNTNDHTVGTKGLIRSILGPILEKHGVSRQMFDTTLYEYSRNPELFDQVYNDVLMKLDILLDENDQEEELSKPGE